MLLPCPWCGLRDAVEFGYVGELVARPAPGTDDPKTWSDYLYVRENRPGWTTERWYHRAGCRRYVVLERHTVTNEVRPHEETLS